MGTYDYDKKIVQKLFVRPLEVLRANIVEKRYFYKDNFRNQIVLWFNQGLAFFKIISLMKFWHLRLPNLIFIRKHIRVRRIVF